MKKKRSKTSEIESYNNLNQNAGVAASPFRKKIWSGNSERNKKPLTSCTLRSTRTTTITRSSRRPLRACMYALAYSRKK